MMAETGRTKNQQESKSWEDGNDGLPKRNLVQGTRGNSPGAGTFSLAPKRLFAAQAGSESDSKNVRGRAKVRRVWKGI